jgi:hypothetical protein
MFTQVEVTSNYTQPCGIKANLSGNCPQQLFVVLQVVGVARAGRLPIPVVPHKAVAEVSKIGNL